MEKKKREANPDSRCRPVLYVGQRVKIDYHNGQMPFPATIVREVLGHYFARHDDCENTVVDVTDLFEPRPCFPTAMLA